MIVALFIIDVILELLYIIGAEGRFKLVGMSNVFTIVLSEDELSVLGCSSLAVEASDDHGA